MAACMHDSPVAVCGRPAGVEYHTDEEIIAGTKSTFGIAVNPAYQGAVRLPAGERDILSDLSVVSPRWWCQGAGRELLRRILEVAEDFGPPRMCLQVQVENERAWKLYEDMGAHPWRPQIVSATRTGKFKLCHVTEVCLVGPGFVVVSTELRPAHLREPTMDRSGPAIAVEEMPEYHMERDVR